MLWFPHHRAADLQAKNWQNETCKSKVVFSKGITCVLDTSLSVCKPDKHLCFCIITMFLDDNFKCKSYSIKPKVFFGWVWCKFHHQRTVQTWFSKCMSLYTQFVATRWKHSPGLLFYKQKRNWRDRTTTNYWRVQ